MTGAWPELPGGTDGGLPEPDQPETPPSVLLVDDDLDFADSLAALLRLEGHHVNVAYGFDEALQVSAWHRPQVALVDIRLGLANGVDLVRELRTRHPDLIAVMITAYATIEATVGALQAGAYDYLCKPFHTNDLLATLERCFERQRLQAERRRAVAALEARNRDLEAVNARLTRVLTDMRKLSRAGSLEEAARSLLAILIRDLGAAGGVAYVHEDERLVRLAESGIVAAFGSARDVPVPDTGLVATALTRSRPVSGPSVELGDVISSGAAGRALALPLIDGDAVLGLVVLQAYEAGFVRQDVDIAQILTSFGAAMMRVVRVSERLASSQTRLRGVVDHSPLAISLTDLEGQQVLSNDRFLEWFPDGVFDQAAPGGSDGRSAGDGAPSHEIEVSPVGGGRRRVLVTRFAVLDDAGQPIGTGTIATDVTERHQAEERLRHGQRMEAIGQLTGGVAHDFNNLLAVVLGNLRLIEEGSQGRPDVLELIEDAVIAARSGVELTGRLLAFGRAQPLDPEVTDIRELVLSMSRLLGRTLGEDITIQLTLAPDLGKVRIDRSQLEASLLNLAINARDAMAAGGQLCISVENAMLGEADVRADPDARAGAFVALSVRDDGTGMTPDIRERAVQPFFTTKRVGRGSGLGLSMVYGFVKQSGGHLRLISEPGQGTTVVLYFPIMTPPHPSVQPVVRSPLPELRGRGERVLLVEDQPQVRQLLKRQLVRLDYQVVDVPDARAALTALDEAPGFDVLLSDIVLPGEMSGDRLGELAAAQNPNLGVILTTGYAADMRADRAVPVRVLRKPVDPDTLARTLRTVIEAGRAEQPHSAAGENM